MSAPESDQCARFALAADHPAGYTGLTFALPASQWVTGLDAGMALIDQITADPVQPFPVNAPGDWFVLHSRPRQEKVLADDLRAMDVPCFLPLARTIRHYGRRKVRVDLPLFPGYVFLRGELDDAYSADRTGRVAQVIRVTDQVRLTEELHGIHRALSVGQPLDPFPYLRQGVRVEVRSGPLRGVRGVIESRIRPDRLILQISIFGRAVSLEVDGAVLDVME